MSLALCLINDSSQDQIPRINEKYMKNNYVERKCQLDATDEIFIADLIACSTCFGHLYAHHQEL
jgi:hypothetical protein